MPGYMQVCAALYAAAPGGHVHARYEAGWGGGGGGVGIVSGLQAICR